MSESRILHCMRAMAWQKAKGEMNAMLETYYSNLDGDKFERFKLEFEAFVKHVENEGLHE